jgi:hypothetical protein
VARVVTPYGRDFSKPELFPFLENFRGFRKGKFPKKGKAGKAKRRKRSERLVIQQIFFYFGHLEIFLGRGPQIFFYFGHLRIFLGRGGTIHSRGLEPGGKGVRRTGHPETTFYFGHLQIFYDPTHVRGRVEGGSSQKNHKFPLKSKNGTQPQFSVFSFSGPLFSTLNATRLLTTVQRNGNTPNEN